MVTHLGDVLFSEFVPVNMRGATSTTEASKCEGYLCVLQCWEKATNYMSIEDRFVKLTEKTYVATPEGVRDLIDENTIGKPLQQVVIHGGES